jgi:protocatechuate 3,4-dioxygenase beta subunit
MNRRTFLGTLAVAIPLAGARRAAAQDLAFIRALERAQAQRPAALAARARIAPETEAGTPLVIEGRVYGDDNAPVPDATVFAYHTDRGGLYDQPSAGPHSWRLKGWARTGADGRFEFRTIRPGAYPSRNIPAHVHFTVFAQSVRFHAGELRFEDDPLVQDDERQRSKSQGTYGWVRSVRNEGDTQHVEFSIRLDPKQKF